MNFFKKKEKPVTILQQCPAEGCEYSTTEVSDMKKHLQWKHPDLTETKDLAAKKS